MEISVKARKEPPKKTAAMKKLLTEAEKAGFIPLGWLIVKTFDSISLAGFANRDGTIALAIYGRPWPKAIEPQAIDLVTELKSGDTVTTSNLDFVNSQPERGIFKYAHPNSNLSTLISRHREHLGEHKSKPVGLIFNLSQLAGFIERFLRNELEKSLLRHWLSTSSQASSKSQKTSRDVDGCYVSLVSRTVRVVMENGNYVWGGWDIHDSGRYNVRSKSEYECTVEFKSDLLPAEPKRVRITRKGTKYLFTEMPGGDQTDVFERSHQKEFLADSKGRKEVEKPILGKGDPSGEYVPVEKTFEKGFVQTIRKDVIPWLIKRGRLNGKKLQGKLHVLDDGSFRSMMQYGIEGFVYNQSAYSFTAIKAPLHALAKLLPGRKDVLAYRENVGASRMNEKAMGKLEEDKRHVFLVQFRGNEWSVLIQVIDWIEYRDIALGKGLAGELSKALKTKAMTILADDTSDSEGVLYKNGREERVVSDADGPDYYGLFYEEGVFLPESFIAANGDTAQLLLSDPALAERVDYMEIKLPG